MTSSRRCLRISHASASKVRLRPPRTTNQRYQISPGTRDSFFKKVDRFGNKTLDINDRYHRKNYVISRRK